jgi:hypothetical protein
LEPTEESVEVRGALGVAESPGLAHAGAKPAEEEEDVPGPDAVAGKVTLGGTRLSEKRAPVPGTRERAAVEIRVQVRRDTGVNTTECQLLDGLSEGATGPFHIRVAER